MRDNVDFTPYISSDENSLKNALSFEYESKVDYSATFDRPENLGDKEHALGHNRVRKKLDMMEKKDDERIEQEKFLYGDDLEDSEEDKHKIHPNEQLEGQRRSEREEEIRINKT